MRDPKCKRFHRVCNEFSLCVNIGEKGYVLSEHPNERFTIFYYLPYGSGKFGKIFESEYIFLDNKCIIDVQDYVNSEVLFQSLEDFYIIGFNTFDKNVKWNSRLVRADENVLELDSKKTFLICFDGKPIVNGKKFKRYDYSQVYSGKTYNIDLNGDGVLVIFSRG
jgi:hypothetical protein